MAAIRVLNRLELVGETLRHALNSLAVVAPDWLRAHVPPEWFDRYGARVENYHLPNTTAVREALGATIRADGRRLLQAVEAATELPWLQQVPAVQTLRQVLGRAVHRAAGTAALACDEGAGPFRRDDRFPL